MLQKKASCPKIVTKESFMSKNCYKRKLHVQKMLQKKALCPKMLQKKASCQKMVTKESFMSKN